MVKKSAVIFVIIASLALSAAICSAYTVNQWPVKGIPNYTIFKGDSPCLPGQHPFGHDCGRIGAFGHGCGDPTGTASATWGSVKERLLRTR